MLTPNTIYAESGQIYSARTAARKLTHGRIPASHTAPPAPPPSSAPAPHSPQQANPANPAQTAAFRCPGNPCLFTSPLASSLKDHILAAHGFGGEAPFTTTQLTACGLYVCPNCTQLFAAKGKHERACTGLRKVVYKASQLLLPAITRASCSPAHRSQLVATCPDQLSPFARHRSPDLPVSQV